MSSDESRTRLSSALQKGLILAQKAFCWLIPIQQWTVWAISLLLAANMVLFSTLVAILSTKAITETILSGLLPHLPTITIIAWLLPDIRNWLVPRIGSSLRNFWGAVTQLYWCRPWDAVRCQLDTETAKEKPKRHTVVLLSFLWLVWLSLAVSSATEHVTRLDWLPSVNLLPFVWLAATTFLLVVSSPAQWKNRRIVVLLSFLWLVWLSVTVSSATEHLTRLDWLPVAWSSPVLSTIDRLSVPDWLRSAWPVVMAFLLVTSLPAQWNKRQPPTDMNESNVQPVMTFRNYGINATTLIRTVLLTWMLTLVYLIASVGLMLVGITHNVTKDGVQHKKITTSVDSLLHNHFPHYVFEEETVFSLLFQKGDTTSMRGICPTGDNLEWLKLFKAAVGQCTARADTGADPQDTARADTDAGPQDTSRERPQIEVSGLASVGPGHGGEDVDPDSAALLNLRVANMRTVSVAAVLLADSTPSTLVVDAERKCLCGSSFSADSVADTLTAHCEGARAGIPDYPIKHRGDHFDVSYTLWSTYGMMHKNAPVNDEGTPADSLLEFLNRTVRITIQNDACRY